MQSWEICRIEESYVDARLVGTSSKKYIVSLFTSRGSDVIRESPVFKGDGDSKLFRSLIATLAEEGWEPIPIPVAYTSSSSEILWFFKRPKLVLSNA